MYLVDLRRGKAPSYPLGRYALYISFFPQAIAGPLARWSEVMHQFGQRVYSPGWQRQFALGFTFIVVGLIGKTQLADRIGSIIDPVYAQASLGDLPTGQAWLAPLLRIPDIVRLRRLQRHRDRTWPVVRRAAAVQFRRTVPFDEHPGFLAALAHDADAVPPRLRVSSARHSRILPRRFLLVQYFAAMLVTMALCGLWHGANWTFVLWGTLHGVALVICSLWRRFCPRLPSLLGWALTVAFVLLTGVIFRSGTLDAALHVFRGLVFQGLAFQGLGSMPDLGRLRHLSPILIAALIAVVLPADQDVVTWLTRRPRIWMALLLGAALLAMLIPTGDRVANDFIYFQF